MQLIVINIFCQSPYPSVTHGASVGTIRCLVVKLPQDKQILLSRDYCVGFPTCRFEIHLTLKKQLCCQPSYVSLLSLKHAFCLNKCPFDVSHFKHYEMDCWLAEVLKSSVNTFTTEEVQSEDLAVFT